MTIARWITMLASQLGDARQPRAQERDRGEGQQAILVEVPEGEQQQGRRECDGMELVQREPLRRRVEQVGEGEAHTGPLRAEAARARRLSGRRSIRGRAVECPVADEITCLIVDDHPSFRAMARALLEAEGFEVVGEAETGIAGLRAAGELRPDLVLLDVQLPDFDGFEVAARLTSANGDSPAVVLTSSRDASDFGPLVAESAAYLKGRKEGDPYQGYRFRILTQQGASAPGGAYNYIITGRMIA